MYQVYSTWKGDNDSRLEITLKDYKSAVEFIETENNENNHFDGLKDFFIKEVRNQQLKSKNMSRGYPSAPYRGQNNNRSFNNGFQNNQNKPVKKKSGCKMTRYFPKSGVNKSVEQTIVNGWKKLYKGSLLVFTAVTTSKSKLSDKGWYGSVAVTVLDKGSMQKQFYWATMEKSTGKVVIKDLGLVMNPKGGKGGVVAEYGRR